MSAQTSSSASEQPSSSRPGNVSANKTEIVSISQSISSRNTQLGYVHNPHKLPLLVATILPKRQYDANLEVLNRHLYVIGGRDPKAQAVGDVYRICIKDHRVYNMNGKIKTWQVMAKLQFPRSDFASAVHQEYIYVIGGADDHSQTLSSGERYIAASDQWEALVEPLTFPRKQLQLVACEEHGLYVIGGQTPDKKVTYVCETNNFLGKEWIKATRMKIPRRSFGAVYLNDQIYVFGGKGVVRQIKSLERFDVVNNQWTLFKVGFRFWNVSAVVFEGKIILAGGSDERNILSWEVNRFDTGTFSFERLSMINSDEVFGSNSLAVITLE